MASVNTNFGALVALQNLNSVTRDLERTQSRISTGLNVASAADNGAIFAIAQGQRARVSSLSAVDDGINRAVSTVDTALAAGSAVSDTLNSLREIAISAQAGGLSASQLSSLQSDFSALRGQIDSVLGAASFNGVNLVNSTTGITVLATDAGGATPSTISVTAANLTTGTGGSLNGLAGLDVSTGAAAAVTAIDTAIGTFNGAIATLGSQRRALTTQQTFLTALSDNVERGIGNLVDADLARESARLQSLQVRQQLGAQALSIANSNAGIALSFFR